MTDVTVSSIDEMEPVHGGLLRRARATLGVSGWGMQVLTLPANWDGYPEHTHGSTAFDPSQEEVYIPLSGSATLEAGTARFELVPGVMARVGPEQPRRILPGPDGIRFVALGGRPGAFEAPSWTELGAPPPMPE
jgi:mannose-6-phosphate isomerase-like protein (cupin superfamily)